MNELLKSALSYRRAGLSVIATDNHKRSVFPWKRYQNEIITEEELHKQFSHQKVAGMAIIAGAVSGGLEIIDVDLKNDVSGKLWSCLEPAIKEAGLWEKLKVISTRSGGFHLYYRCEVIDGNKKLALRPATAEELKENPSTKDVVVIETRGEGGYCIAPPSEGYKPVSGRLQVLTIDERDCLLEICRSFNEVVEQLVVPATSRPDAKEYGLSPFDDFNKRGDVVGLLVKHGWRVVKEAAGKTVFKRPGNTDSKSSGDFNHNLNWFSVFTTNSVFEPNKAYLPYAVYAKLECEGDYKKAAKALLDAGYGERRESSGNKLEREIFKRRQGGAQKEELVGYLVHQEKKSSAEAEELIDKLEQQWGESILTFWDVDKNGKITINRYRLERFLSDTGGFHLYFYDKSNLYRFIKVKDGFVEEASSEQVKKFVKDYVNSLPDSFDGGITPHDLLEVIYKGADAYFNKSFLEFIDRINLSFLKDSKYRAYFPFKNGVVMVEKGKPTIMKSYGDIGHVIWRNQVIDFDITIDQDFEASLCEYMRFVDAISGREEDRRMYALSLIGYMLHGWKDPTKPFAPILAEETDDEKKGGGTGKGIFIKAIGHIIPVVRIDGKNFKIDKNFAFQRVGLDTKLVVIEDSPKNVDFEKYYPTITEGITIEKKNKDELFLPYDDSPKIAFTTNYTINQEAEHAKRRQKVFEFAQHYSSTYTPHDEFGHNLFEDWDKDEWNRFYNLMFMCVGIYLDRGVLSVANSEKLKRKHIRLSFGEEFLDYWDEFMSNGHANWHASTQEYNSFLRVNEFEKKDYSIQRFRRGLTAAASVFDKKMETRRNKQAASQSEFRVSDPTPILAEPVRDEKA